MPYKELTLDYLLGRTLRAGGESWVVVEAVDHDCVRLLDPARPASQTRLHWPTLQRMIAGGDVDVD